MVAYCIMKSNKNACGKPAGDINGCRRRIPWLPAIVAVLLTREIAQAAVPFVMVLRYLEEEAF